MISDTLSDAAATVRDYLRIEPETYADRQARALIDKALQAMDTARTFLDTPPAMP